ncbi:MAG: hypothetical protein ACXWLH_04725 [Candidatus Saccharimonadales bacterium]
MKKLNTKGFSAFETLLVLLVLVIVGALSWYAYLHQGGKSVISKISKSQPASHFYYTENSGTVVVYDPVTAKKTTIKLTLDENRFFSSFGTSNNKNVQLSSNGQEIFYLSTKPKPGFVAGGEGEPEHDSTILSVFADNKETKLITVKATAGLTISDWIVTTDGATIYYLEQQPDKGNTDLHSFDVASKKDTTIKANVAEASGINNPIRLAYDGTLVFYSNGDNYYLTRHEVKANFYDSKKLGAPCNCGLAGSQPISPDSGEKLILEVQSSGEAPSDFTYYLLDVARNKKTQLAKLPTNTMWLSPIWSPNAQNIVYATASFAQESTFKQKLEVINLKNLKTKSIVDTELTAKDNVAPMSWSPDGRYIVYSNGNKVKFYDVKTGKTLDSSLDAESISSGDQSFGWY